MPGNEYTDDALRRTEEAIQMALEEIRESRARFRSALGAMMDPPPPRRRSMYDAAADEEDEY